MGEGLRLHGTMKKRTLMIALLLSLPLWLAVVLAAWGWRAGGWAGLAWGLGLALWRLADGRRGIPRVLRAALAVAGPLSLLLPLAGGLGVVALLVLLPAMPFTAPGSEAERRQEAALSFAGVLPLLLLAGAALGPPA